MTLRHQRREASAVAHAQDNNAIGVDEVILAHRRERSAPAGKLGVKVGLCTNALTLSYPGLVHAYGRIA